MSIIAKFHMRSSRNARDIREILVFPNLLRMENLYLFVRAFSALVKDCIVFYTFPL